MQQQQQILILAEAFDALHASKPQLSNVRTFIDQISRDPRVKSIYGTNGQGTGCALWCDVPNYQEADRIAALAQVYGLANVQIIHLVPTEQLRVGLQEAERFAPQQPSYAVTPGPMVSQPN
jgi:hypothetical protein